EPGLYTSLPSCFSPQVAAGDCRSEYETKLSGGKRSMPDSDLFDERHPLRQTASECQYQFLRERKITQTADSPSFAGVGDCAIMFVAKPAHKAAARSDDFMFVVIEASQGEDTRLFVVADNAPRRFVAPRASAK